MSVLPKKFVIKCHKNMNRNFEFCWKCLTPFFFFISLPSTFLQLKNKFMKKIPRDAEASNVLVGEVDFLNKPFVAFVRLAQATTLGGLTEVPVPTR